MIERGIGTARGSHSGANKSKESAGKREVARRGMGTRGGTGAVRTGVRFPHLAALHAHVFPALRVESRRNQCISIAVPRSRIEITERRLSFNDLRDI
jgi:hypothetical protein